MNNTIKAITEQQGNIIFNHMDCTDIETHIKDIDIIANLTIIKIILRMSNKSKSQL